MFAYFLGSDSADSPSKRSVDLSDLPKLIFRAEPEGERAVDLPDSPDLIVLNDAVETQSVHSSESSISSLHTEIQSVKSDSSDGEYFRHFSRRTVPTAAGPFNESDLSDENSEQERPVTIEEIRSTFARRFSDVFQRSAALSDQFMQIFRDLITQLNDWQLSQ